MRRWLLLAAVAAALAVVAFLVVARRPAMPGSAPEPAQPSAALEPVVPETPSVIPVWLGKPARRIAGRVLDEGRPVAGATVQLATVLERTTLLALRELTTDDSGRFDLGLLPAARYVVSATARARAPTAVVADLRSPEPSDHLELVLRPCSATVFGVVRDSSAGSIAGSLLRARDRRGTTTTRSDERGGYELCVSSDFRDLEAAAAGYGTRTFRTSAFRRSRLDVMLSPEVVIEGRVTDGKDGPGLPGAAVLAMWDASSVAVFSGEDGRFRLEGLAPGEYRVHAVSGPRIAAKIVRVLRAAQTTEGVILALPPPGVLSGRVRAGDEPIAGATVRVISDDWRVWSGVTDDAGRFTIEHSSIAPLTLQVSGCDVVSPAEAPPSGPPLEVQVRRRAVIAGRVTHLGQPVQDAMVIARHERFGDSALSSSDGSFEVKDLRPGTYRVQAEHLRIGAMSTSQTITVADGERRDGVTIELDLDASVAGLVEDATGAPVAGALVDLACEEKDFGQDVTGDDGRFVARGLSGSCSYQASVRRSPSVGALLPPASGRPFPEIAVKDGQTHVENVRLVVALPDLAISGHVLRQGSPVPDVTVRAVGDDQQVDAVTDSAGTFSISPLSAGEYRLTTDSPDGNDEIVKAKAGNSEVILHLRGYGRVEGEAVGFTRLDRVAISGKQMLGPRDADIDGTRFEATDLPEGTFNIVAFGGSETASADLEVKAGEVTHVTLWSIATVRVFGVLRDLRTGKPEAGQSCAFTSGGALASSRATMYENGRFEMRGVPGERVAVMCFLIDGRTGHTAPFEVAQGGTAEVEVYAFDPPVPKGDPGVRLDPSGVVVEHTKPDINPELVVGDRVTRVDDVALPPSLRLGEPFLANHEPGKPYTATVLRDGQTVMLTLRNGAR